MAFNWQISNITNDIKIDSNILNEIKNNLDTLSDACSANKVTNYIGYYTAYNITVRSSNYINYDGSYRGGHDYGDCKRA